MFMFMFVVTEALS